MQAIIKLIGIIIIVQGGIFLLRPDLMRQVIRFFTQGDRLYIAAVVRITFAVVFFVGATQCRLTWLIIALGILLLISGIMILTVKLSTLKRMMGWYHQRSDIFLRLLTVILIAFGAIIVYAV